MKAVRAGSACQEQSRLFRRTPTSLGTQDRAGARSPVRSTGNCWAQKPFAPAVRNLSVSWNISTTLNLTTKGGTRETSRCVLPSSPAPSPREAGCMLSLGHWDWLQRGNAGNSTLTGSGSSTVRAEAFAGKSRDSLQGTRYHVLFCRLFWQEHQKNLWIFCFLLVNN